MNNCLRSRLAVKSISNLSYINFSKTLRLFITLHLLFLLPITNISAQESDSIKTYYFKDVTVNGMLELEPESFIQINAPLISKSDASTIIEFGKKIPSVKVQTNSRGESLFFFRGSGERQLTLFFDGVPINIPWDNRIDLSLIPSQTIEEVTILKGVPPAIFGTNAISGVINISSKNLSEKSGLLSVQIGENNHKSFSGLWGEGNDKLSYLISASYKNSDGFRLPENFDDVSNLGTKRINSYVETKNIFGKVNYKFSDSFESGLFVSYIDSKKGVPPEIGAANPRYWKYPLWKNLIIAANGNLKINEHNSALVYNFSLTQFNLQIDQYNEPSFKTINETEKNDDQVFRGRLVYTNVISDNSLIKVAFNGQSFRHEEKFLSNNFSPLTYSENILSIGTEYEYVKEKYVISFGGSYDWLNTPKTGGKPGKVSQSDYAINGAFVYRLQNDLSVRLNLGRKTRFPSLRETFSGALGRFIPNPGLKAEVAHSGEISFNYKNQFVTADASFFLTYLSDGIVRESLSGGKFMRVNKEQIRTYGFEFASSYKPNEKLNMVFNFTYLNAKAKNAGGEFKDTLEYRPQLTSSLNFDYTFSADFSALAEFEYTGKEFGLKEGSAAFQKLPEYLIVNLRAAYQFLFEGNYKIEFYIRLNNFFDRLYYTQLGLPEAGRQYFFGMNLNI